MKATVRPRYLVITLSIAVKFLKQTERGFLETKQLIYEQNSLININEANCASNIELLRNCEARKGRFEIYYICLCTI